MELKGNASFVAHHFNQSGEGAEGEEPPEGIHDDDGDEEMEDDDEEDDEEEEEEDKAPDGDGSGSSDAVCEAEECSGDRCCSIATVPQSVPVTGATGTGTGTGEDCTMSPARSETELGADVIADGPCLTVPPVYCSPHQTPTRENDNGQQKDSSSNLAVTPPPPVLQRCSSSESVESIDENAVPSTFHAVPPRLAVIPNSSPRISSSAVSPPPFLVPIISPPMKSPMEVDTATVLDFSTKRQEPNSPSPVLNLSKCGGAATSGELLVTNGPLDLSLGSSRKRDYEDNVLLPAKKPSRIPVSPISPWSTPLLTYPLPYFSPTGNLALQQPNKIANTASPQMDPSMWNGKAKLSEKSAYGVALTPTDATKALEKMSELSKLGKDDFRPIVMPTSSTMASGRHSAWQSHWLNKGAEQAKDVLKCVWCKQSFPSLAAMTTHMQEAKHCGVNVPGMSSLQSVSSAAVTPQPQISTASSALSSPSASSGKSNSSDLNLLIKETMPLPRKLVRGQDVWLGKGAEQTRQILKCMWCGQSFRSLAEMTSHMQQTQHYTNIISQEQIISWKSAEEGKSSNGNSAVASGSSGGNSATANSHVSAVLTCKVCDQAFSSLKELSNHMVKNSHYKEHIMRSITESGGRRRQTREKRKKSLPVRKLLELERAQNELKNGDNMMMMMMMSGKSGIHSSHGRITCEKCGEKIDMASFVDHIRLCVGGSNATGSTSQSKKNLLKNALLSYNSNSAANDYADNHRNFGKTKEPGDHHHHQHHHHRRNSQSARASDLSVNKDNATKQDGVKSSSPSVLNAIEKLIEKSFDPRSRHGVTNYLGAAAHGNGNTSIGSSILKRLGIDESVDYTKPLMDINIQQAAKAYMLSSSVANSFGHHEQNYFTAKRERSGSESSSISERGSSRHDSLTPDRKYDLSDRIATPRTTPEKRISTPPSSKASESPEELHLKKEPKDYEEEPESDLRIKKEPESGNEEEEKKELKRNNRHSSREASCTPNSIPPPSDERDLLGEDLSSKRSRRSESSPGLSPGHSTVEGISASPSTVGSPNSERSVTPRCSNDKKSSLGALSSMFDSLSASTNSAGASETTVPSKGSSHPLAALQKLCDKTDTHHPPSSGNSRSSNSRNHSPSGAVAQQSSPGAILAFSWACNDAVVTDSIMKCAFCDTPFISKGAYRHHLSKMHFVKDGVIPDPVPLKSQNSILQNSIPVTSNSKSNNGSPHFSENNNKITASSPASSSSPTAGGSMKSPQNNNDESPHSKFLKYTELAKQLSSKYV